MLVKPAGKVLNYRTEVTGATDATMQVRRFFVPQHSLVAKFVSFYHFSLLSSARFTHTRTVLV